MRILAVTNIYPSPERSFSGTFIEQQVKSLRESGIQVDVLFADRDREGIGVYWRLRHLLREKMHARLPDLVHVMYGGVMAKVVTRLVRMRPVIVSFCGSDLLGENWPGRLRKLMVAYGVRASHQAARRAAGIVVKSRNLYEALPLGIDACRVRIIPNGIDLNRFKPLNPETCRKQLGWNPSRIHVLFPANTGTPRKRLWLAQAALEAAKQRGLNSELHLLQGVPHEEVPLWLNASDIVLLTSEHEGSPNIIKEALACNVPIVSVNVGDVAERIEGVNGCFISEANASSLAEKLEWVRKGERRINGRAIMNELSLECVARRLALFYEEVQSAWHSESCHEDVMTQRNRERRTGSLK